MKKLLAAALAVSFFAGGLLAPDTWRAAVKARADQLLQSLGVSSVSESTTGADAPKQTAAQKADTAAVPFSALRRPLSLSTGRKLGLGLGLFTSPEGGAALATQVEKLAYKVQWIPLKDENGALWYKLVAGAYDSEAEAERQRSILSASIPDVIDPEIVLIPLPPKKH
jgi:septal ring-binding cell division protein DamX